MRIAVLGAGATGARYATQLRADGHRVVVLDSAGSARSGGARSGGFRAAGGPGSGPGPEAALGLGSVDPGMVDVWAVATPTPTRLGLLRGLLRLDPAARVLLEQPACSPADLPALADTAHAHPRARIAVNDVYGHSSAVRRFAEVVAAVAEREPGGDRMARITVEFTKNRERDVEHGRFVDTEYGAAGYEWFHMLSILRAILPPAGYAAYLGGTPEQIAPEMRVVMNGRPGLPEIALHASTHGRIGFPGAACFAFSYPLARRRISRGHIPYGSELRYRFAEVEFVSGARVTLVFEPRYQTAKDYRNVHTVHVRDAAGAPRGGSAAGWAGRAAHRAYPLAVNQLREALAAQLAALTAPDRTPAAGPADRAAGLRPAEHRHLAMLAARPQAHQAARDLGYRGGPPALALLPRYAEPA
jgi:hypothetical protein